MTLADLRRIGPAADQAGVGSSLAAGDYELSKSMSIPEIIQVLANGEVKRGLVATSAVTASVGQPATRSVGVRDQQLPGLPAAAADTRQ